MNPIPLRLATPAAARRLLAVWLAALILTLAPAAAPAVRAAEPPVNDVPMILQSIQWQDLRANRHGICNGAFQVVMKNVTAGAKLSSLHNYLAEAEKCGLKVIFHFSGTISGGTVYPSRVARLVNAVKNSPTLYGYLSVKEPSWVGVSGREIRSLYRAFKAADPAHPVIALFGDIPHFGESVNPYTTGMADVVMVDWYPVETANGGCSSRGTSYRSSGPKWYAKVKAKVAAVTPGRPVYAMLQTHKNLSPRCHKKQLPTKLLLWRMAREAIANGDVKGIAFHTWTNSVYQVDQVRNPTMVGWMKEMSAQIRGGTFQ